MSAYEDRQDFFDHMAWLLDSIEVRRGEFLRMSPAQADWLWIGLERVHESLEEIKIEIDRQIRLARGEQVGPPVTLGIGLRAFGEEMRLTEIAAEVHKALAAKTFTKGPGRNWLWFHTDDGREFVLRRIGKQPYQEQPTYVVEDIREVEA